MNIFEQVAEFHRAFDLPIFDSYVPPSAGLKALRIKLLQEEYDELVVAYSDLDMVEIADALADMAYIICGTAHSYGIPPPNLWEPEFADNVTPVDLAQVSDTLSDASSLEATNKREQLLADFFNRMEIVAVMFETYLRCEKHDYVEGIQSSMFALLVEISILSHLLGIPFRAVFKEVHRSNMAKLDKNGTVLRREDGKVIKPEGWTPPDIAGVLWGKSDEQS
jgi:predicted HAD superfamily Cof-like phosphohydrolase